MQKVRLDVLLAERGLVASREKARAVIMAGEVFVEGLRVDKPGASISPEAQIVVRADTCPYVSRGGLKLQKAMEVFDLSLEGLVCADIGSSTGGFTDCMLQHGAAKVYAVDVGHGQLDWKLRNDVRVVVMERTNARYLTAEDLQPPPVFASVDVSFISLRLMFPMLAAVGVNELVTLIKPQFEAGREYVGKKGVVRDEAVHTQVVYRVFEDARTNGFAPAGLDYSPIKGPNGNIEFIAYYRRNAYEREFSIEEIVHFAHKKLNSCD